MPAPFPARHAPGRLTLWALALAVTAAHFWLLAPRNTFAPRPPVTWRVRWIATPQPAPTAPQTPSPAPSPAHTQAPRPDAGSLAQATPPTPDAMRTPARDGSLAVSRAVPRASSRAAPPDPAPAAAPGGVWTRASATASEAMSSADSGVAAPDAAHAADTARAAADPAPVRLPPAVTWHYQVTGTRRGEAVEGASTLIWSPGAAAYRATWERVSPQLGRHGQTSEGALQTSGLTPERYGERQRSEQAAHFDPAGRRVRFSANTPDALWQPGTQDRLSALLQLAALLAAAPDRYPAGSAIRLPTASARDVADALWQVEGDAAMDVDGTTIPCLKLRRDPVGPYDSRTELWLARDAHYLPARLRITRGNGDTVEHTWQPLPP